MSSPYTEVKFVSAVSAVGSVNFVASGVNFSRNNATYNLMKVQSTFYPDFISKTVDILLISWDFCLNIAKGTTDPGVDCFDQ